MKTSYQSFSRFFIWCLFCALFVSCNKDPEYFTLVDYPDQMHIKSSVEDIVFNKGIANQEAVTFTWDAAVSPLQPSDEVTYKIGFYDTNQKETNHSEFIDLGNVTSVSFTHDELNTIVARWVMPGEPLDVTAQLLAVVHNEKTYVKPIQSTVSFKATCYEKYPTYMYIRITDPITETVKTERMEQRQLGTGIYEVGKRVIVIDTNAEENNYRMYLPLPSSNMPWIVGNATDIGWETNQASGKFKVADALHAPYIYTWTGNLIAGGEFKIGLGTGWGDSFFYAPGENTDPFADSTLLPYRLQDQGGDLKWVPTKSGPFTITLSLLVDDMWIKVEP